MKYLIILLSILFTFTAQSANFPDYLGLVNDYENVLSDKQEKSLTKLLEKNETAHQVKIILVSTKTFAPADNYRKYILGLFEHWKMNSSNTKKGILVLVSKNKQTLKIIPGTEMNVIFSEAKVREVVENVMSPKFLKEKYFSGLKKGLKSMVNTIKAYNKAK